jgi:hypothetical protein
LKLFPLWVVCENRNLRNVRTMTEVHNR